MIGPVVFDDNFELQAVRTYPNIIFTISWKEIKGV